MSDDQLNKINIQKEKLQFTKKYKKLENIYFCIIQFCEVKGKRVGCDLWKRQEKAYFEKVSKNFDRLCSALPFNSALWPLSYSANLKIFFNFSLYFLMVLRYFLKKLPKNIAWSISKTTVSVALLFYLPLVKL